MDEKSDHVFRGSACPPPFGSNFAHLLAFKNLVINVLNAKIWAKMIEKKEWLYTRPGNLHTVWIL